MKEPTGAELFDFISESNSIEGIFSVSDDDVEAYKRLLAADRLTEPLITGFVQQVEPRALLRSKRGMDVQIQKGNEVIFRPPQGAPGIKTTLEGLLQVISTNQYEPYEAHVQFETLHPYMDGNGRAGRAIWAWHMRINAQDPFARGFLTNFYYQSLQANREEQDGLE